MTAPGTPPRVARGTAPYPPPARSITSDLKPLRYREFRCAARGCAAVVSLTEFDMLPDGWTVTADQHHPRYTCGACAAAAGLTVAPPAPRPAMGAGELERRWDELNQQVREWEALADVADQLGRHDLAAARREIAAECRAERDTMVPV